MSSPLKALLGDRLLEKQLVTANELEVALSEQRRAHRPLGEILISLGFVREEDIVQLVGEDLGIEFLRANEIEPDAAITSNLDEAFVRDAQAFPYELKNGELRLVMVNPSDPIRISRVRERFPYPLDIAITTSSDLKALMHDHLQRQADAVSGIFAEILEAATLELDSIPIERLTHAILQDAVHRCATDIHIEPEEHVTRLRYRIDGVLETGEGLPVESTPAVISRIKVLAGLDISERRLPQDGHVRLEFDDKPIDFRVSLLPCSFGENVVIRVLDANSSTFRLGELGVSNQHQKLLTSVASRSHGIFLVTGPTGSGKTTTLYSLLNRIDATKRKVATIEDPIEMLLPLVRQSQVDRSIGYHFQNGLRALLRQDPDVILIGEIRDNETAQMAVRAAMTGHLVFSTLHTNSCLGAIPRLRELGIDPFLIDDTLIGTMGQRLVRTNCGACSEPVTASVDEIAWLGCQLEHVMRGVGCPRCSQTGYSGRTVLVEMFLPHKDASVVSEASHLQSDVSQRGADAGYYAMEAEGRRAVLAGRTTMDEFLRVYTSVRLDAQERES
ncbi:MAG: type IV pilus assembly protein PilB [Planctomycetota bacterium]|jgi:type IV pilus assembly protein PilB